MQEVLRGTFRTLLRKTKERGPPLDIQGIDISIISSIGFYYQYKDDNAELSSISIYKVDCILEECLYEDEIRENQIQIPKQYYAFANVASKRDSDTLVSYRSYDYKIKLTSANYLRLSPLYKMSTDEL